MTIIDILDMTRVERVRNINIKHGRDKKCE